MTLDIKKLPSALRGCKKGGRIGNVARRQKGMKVTLAPIRPPNHESKLAHEEPEPAPAGEACHPLYR
jgi:hypothetical protein